MLDMRLGKISEKTTKIFIYIYIQEKYIICQLPGQAARTAPQFPPAKNTVREASPGPCRKL